MKILEYLGAALAWFIGYLALKYIPGLKPFYSPHWLFMLPIYLLAVPLKDLIRRRVRKKREKPPRPLPVCPDCRTRDAVCVLQYWETDDRRVKCGATLYCEKCHRKWHEQNIPLAAIEHSKRHA